jgi:hypothetical protein
MEHRVEFRISDCGIKETGDRSQEIEERLYDSSVGAAFSRDIEI